MQIFESMPEYKLSATSITQEYNIIEAAGLDGFTVKTALLNYAPVTNTDPASNYAWPRRALTLEEVQPGQWKASITWSSLAYQYATEIGGSQQQVRCDKSVVTAYPNPNLPGGAGQVPAILAAGSNGAPIGFDGRTVHGASIYIPTRSWTETVEIPASQYGFDYEDKVNAVDRAPVNKNMFRGYAAGDVLFQGMNASLSTQNPDFVTASFKFSQSEGNRNDADSLPPLNVGGIQNIVKDGWDLLDVRYQQQVDPTAQVMVPAAMYVVIHRVYDRSDFSALNIGTGESLPLWQG